MVIDTFYQEAPGFIRCLESFEGYEPVKEKDIRSGNYVHSQVLLLLLWPNIPKSRQPHLFEQVMLESMNSEDKE